MKHRTLAAWFLRCTAFLLALLAVGPAPASAARFVVDSTRDRPDANLRDGVCADSNGRCTLRAAVEHVNYIGGYHAIELTAASYSVNSPLTITTRMAIKGRGSDRTRIDCENSSEALLVERNGDLNLDNVAVEKCLPSENRGRLFLTDVLMQLNIGPVLWNYGSLEVLGSTFRNNFDAGTAGGVVVNEAFMSIFYTTFEENRSNDRGGAILNRGELVAAISRFEKNTASLKGGAIYNTGKIDLELVTFDGNSAYEGGALYSHLYGEVMSRESSFINNRAFLAGGAIVSNASDVRLVSSTVSGNQALEGGGLYSFGEPDSLWLANATITNNTAAPADGNIQGAGGGLYGPAILSNTILAGNTSNGRGLDCYSAATAPVSRDHNIIGILDNCGLSLRGTDEAGDLGNPLDPKLLPLDDTTWWPPFHEPDEGSLAIDFGNPAGCALPGEERLILLDQREYPRHQGAACDAGAIEVR